jgi:hypothetical protein
MLVYSDEHDTRADTQICAWAAEKQHEESTHGLDNLGAEKYAQICRTLLDTSAEILATHPEARVRFPAFPDFLRSSGSGTGFTQPREYN